MFRAVLGLCALTLAAVAPFAVQAQARPPVAAYGRLPAIETAVISPDGARLAYVGGTADDRVIFITPIDGGAPVTIRPGAVNVKGLRWAGNKHLLVGISMFENGNDYSAGKTAAYSYHRDLIVDVATGQVAGQVLGQRSWNALALSIPVLAVVEDDKPYIIVQGLDLSPDAGVASGSMIKKKGGGIVPALWRVDLANGKGRMLDRGNRTTQSYITDLTGEARVRGEYDDVRNVETLMVRAKGAAVWKQVDSWKIEQQTADYIGYSDPDDALIVRRVVGGASRLIKLPLSGGPEVDLVPNQTAAHAEVKWDEDRMMPVAVITGDERPTYQWLDPQLAAVHARLSKALSGKQVTLASWSRDRGRVIVVAEAPDSPPVWYLYDVKTKQASLIAESYPELTGAAFGKTAWLSYPARDGLKIPAYLTLPPARADGKKPPLIVLPHGGPESRDEYGFDWIVQFLASRGYAVLQPQFRGSTGFGDDFTLAGRGEWGGKMQTDLVDGVAAMAAQGVDNSRTCIVGLSYGGYAALAGAAFQPDVFRCAVSVSGVADLPLWIGDTRRTYGEESGALAYWRTAIGDPRTSGAAMAAASPARRLGGRASPILLMHAELDTTVPLEQAQTMERALKGIGQTAPLVLLEGDDHYLSKSKSRIKFLSETEAFLGKHLPVAP